MSLSGTFRREGGQPVSGMDQLEMVVSSRPRTDVWDKPRDYSWARVSVDANGGFSIPAISEGTVEFLVRYPPEFSYRPSRDFTVQSRHISAADPRTVWTIPLDHAVRVRGKILSRQSGSPVAHVLIWNHYSSDMINRFSDEEGDWSLWLARGTACELQVIPTLGDVALTSDNDTLVTVDAESGEQQVEPFYVRGSTTTRGMVRDQQGAALAGSVIVCERRSGDFWWKHTLYSGSDGSFPLLGVADGDTIRLSARFDPTVARQLVEPCCDEFSWLYDESQPTLAYHRCGLLAAATRIDPNWAAQIVQRIATTGLAADDMRRLELVCGVIDQLRAMIVDVQRMNSKQ